MNLEHLALRYGRPEVGLDGRRLVGWAVGVVLRSPLPHSPADQFVVPGRSKL